MLNTEASSSAEDWVPTHLRCEYRIDPLGVDAPQPRLSWIVESTERGQVQTAYQVQVATNLEGMKKNRADLWDSGKVASNQTLQVEYQGRPLESQMRCFWRVRVWNKEGKGSPWSDLASWEMALLRESDWGGKWINDGKPLPEKAEDFFKEDPAPLFRKEFAADKSVARARLYISGLGYYEATLNGKPVGDRRLDPGWTTYSKRVLYSVYDVTTLIQAGSNCLGVVLGNGWYNPLPMRMWGRYNLRENLTVGRPRLIAQLFFEYTDGTHEIVPTDESWKVAGGPILRNNIYFGEVYDARKEQPGWDRAGYDDAGWRPASLSTEPIGKLQVQAQPPVKVTAIVHPVAISEPTPGVFIFDMGQNFAGWAKLRVEGPAGTAVKMRFGELLYPDGTLNVMTSVAGQLKVAGQGGPGAPPLGYQSDTYILKGRGEEVYTPRFTFHGFRYVEVTGYPARPTLQAIEGLRLNAAVAPAGSFECSNETLNRIQEMVQWTFLSNLFSVQSDCPHRERFGYGGDMIPTAEAFMFNFDMAAFYSKIVSDYADAARPSGGMTETAPYVGIADDGFGEGSGPIGWGIAHAFLQSKLFQYYGEQRIPAEQYEATRRYTEFLRSHAKEHIIDVGISDHESLDPKPVALTGTAFYYHQAELASQLAKLAGRAEDAQRYADLAAEIKKAFIEKFFNADSGRYDLGTQACQSFPLHYDLVPRVKSWPVFDVLLDEVTERHQGRLATGIFGTRFLLEVLSESGHVDLACALVTQKEFPGWGHMLAGGATTLWEHWEFSDNVYSHNHPMFGSVSAWFYESLAGIRPYPEAVGFNHIVIRPRVCDEVEWVKAHYDSIRGRIASHWRVEEGVFQLDLTIPANTIATVIIPTSDPLSVTERGRTASQAEGVTFLSADDNAAVYRVQSGQYKFRADLRRM